MQLNINWILYNLCDWFTNAAGNIQIDWTPNMHVMQQIHFYMIFL